MGQKSGQKDDSLVGVHGKRLVGVHRYIVASVKKITALDGTNPTKKYFTVATRLYVVRLLDWWVALFLNFVALHLLMTDAEPFALRVTSGRWYYTASEREIEMTMSCKERKAAQRARPDGYGKSRQCRWNDLGIVDATYEGYVEQLVAQHYECPICHCPLDQTAPYDHSHQTGATRGVLCQGCNLLLGRVENGTVDFFLNAAVYLRKWEVACV